MSNARGFRPLLSLSSVIWLLLTALPAVGQCGCFQIMTNENPTPCTSKGCSNQYYYEYCGGGCTPAADCFVSGYGLCCKTEFKTYSLDTQGCGGHPCDDCGEIRTRPPSAHAEASRGFRQTGGPGNLYGKTWAWPQNTLFGEEMLYVPNRCKHTYGVIYPQDLVKRQTSPAAAEPHSGMTSAPTGGGL